MNRFFVLVGAMGAISALAAIGASIGIVLRLLKDGTNAKTRAIILLASSWCILASTYVVRYWVGAYDSGDASDRFALWCVFLGFTLGGWGLLLLWNRPNGTDKEKSIDGT